MFIIIEGFYGEDQTPLIVVDEKGRPRLFEIVEDAAQYCLQMSITDFSIFEQYSQ
ncbi:hypothetical protein [Spirosoma flavum]|uniref:Uncharacterized protein n=1 Tax=Spirosoma flavum TaxID=2048557 RepID=A0ABW6AM22_9BACT